MKRVHERISISKSDALSVLQWEASINKTIIKRQPLEGPWIHNSCRSKPPTSHMNVWRCTPTYTCVHYLYYEFWDSCCWISALWNAYVPFWALPFNLIHFSKQIKHHIHINNNIIHFINSFIHFDHTPLIGKKTKTQER